MYISLYGAVGLRASLWGVSATGAHPHQQQTALHKESEIVVTLMCASF